MINSVRICMTKEVSNSRRWEDGEEDGDGDKDGKAVNSQGRRRRMRRRRRRREREGGRYLWFGTDGFGTLALLLRFWMSKFGPMIRVLPA